MTADRDVAGWLRFFVTAAVLLPLYAVQWLITAGWMDSEETDETLVNLRVEAMHLVPWLFPIISDDGETWTWPEKKGDDTSDQV